VIVCFPPWKLASLPHRLGRSTTAAPLGPETTSCDAVPFTTKRSTSKEGGSVSSNVWKIKTNNRYQQLESQSLKETYFSNCYVCRSFRKLLSCLGKRQRVSRCILRYDSFMQLPNAEYANHTTNI
jgi:hypothetical protein